MPTWGIVATVVGGMLLLGGVFAGGVGAGFLIGHRSVSSVEQSSPRTQFLDRLDEGGQRSVLPDRGAGTGQQRGFGGGAGSTDPQDDGDQDGATDGSTTAP